jgi:hypothetical protein
VVIDLKEDRLGENLRADERVVYRAPRGHGRLNRRALKIQAFIGLVVFVAISFTSISPTTWPLQISGSYGCPTAGSATPSPRG